VIEVFVMDASLEAIEKAQILSILKWYT